MGKLTNSIVEFLSSERVANPPEKALTLAGVGFTDCVAVMVAGVGEPVTRNLLNHVGELGGLPASRIMLSDQRATVSQATLVGVASAHALDFDDYAFSNHVSALLVPAILAEAERTPCTGRDLLLAYLAGFECWGAVMKREPDHLHSKGWHPTGVFGPIGVAAALAWLRKLSPTQTANALGLAAANAGGVMDNFGTQAKAYQGARAAEAGVVCVEMALAGLDGGRDAIDGSGGLLAALSPRGQVDLESDADWLGDQWIAADDSLNIKLHPTVGASQRAIDAAIQLHRDYGPPVESIKAVTARVSEKHAAVMRFHQPANGLEAKFSVEFGVAAGLIAGRVGLRELEDGFVAGETLQQLIRKVSVEVGPDDDPDYPVGAKWDTVSVELTDGKILDSEPVRRFRGHGQNPLTPAELKTKFLECTTLKIDERKAGQLFSKLQDLSVLKRVDEIPSLDL